MAAHKAKHAGKMADSEKMGHVEKKGVKAEKKHEKKKK